MKNVMRTIMSYRLPWGFKLTTPPFFSAAASLFLTARLFGFFVQLSFMENNKSIMKSIT